MVFPYVPGLSGFWLSKQCQVWVPSSGVDLKSNQILGGYSHKVYASIALAYFAGRTGCRSKVLWLGWCTNFSFCILKSTFSCHIDCNHREAGTHTGINLTSPYTISCEDVILRNRTLPSFYREQSIVLATA